MSTPSAVVTSSMASPKGNCSGARRRAGSVMSAPRAHPATTHVKKPTITVCEAIVPMSSAGRAMMLANTGSAPRSSDPNTMSRGRAISDARRMGRNRPRSSCRATDCDISRHASGTKPAAIARRMAIPAKAVSRIRAARSATRGSPRAIAAMPRANSVARKSRNWSWPASRQAMPMAKSTATTSHAPVSCDSRRPSRHARESVLAATSAIQSGKPRPVNPLRSSRSAARPSASAWARMARASGAT